MKSAPTNSQLDTFIRNTLKSSDGNFQPVDWSEVEVLLKHEQKSISVGISKKNIFIAVAAAGILVLLVSIFKIIQHYSSLPGEPEILADSTQHTFNLIDNQSTAIFDSVVLKADTSKIDSSSFANAKRNNDSVSTLVVTDKEIYPVIKTTQKQGKKKKTDTMQNLVPVDTASVKAVSDTVSTPPSKEIIIENPTVPDTITKKTSPENNGSKKKKSKSKKATPPPSDQIKSDTPVAKPDSLKQQ